MVSVTIDGQQYEAEEGTTVLQLARAHGIKIPTLCFHPALKPAGSCKLCSVEVPGRRKAHTMLSCILKVKEGLEVKTDGELVYQARRRAFQRLLQMAPQARVIRDLAEEYGIELGPPPDGCIRCRLCIRVCREIVGASSLKMEKRNGQEYVVPVEGRCIGCGTCVNICPTDVIQMVDRDGIRTISIRDEIIGIHALKRCEGCGKLFATERFLERVAERATHHHPDVKEHHRYCPTCAKLFSDRVKALSRPRR